VSERIFGSSPSSDVFDEITADTEPSQPDPRTSAGAYEAASRTVERTRAAQPYADTVGDALRERMVEPGLPMSEQQEQSYVAALQRVHDEEVARNMLTADGSALDREVTAFRERRDVQFFNEQAEREVLMIWRDTLGARPGALEQAYRLWHDNQFSHKELRKAIKAPSADDLKTSRGALRIVSDIAAVRRQRESAYRTQRETKLDDARTKKGAMQRATARVDASREAEKAWR
jgi:hypothetical protein